MPSTEPHQTAKRNHIAAEVRATIARAGRKPHEIADAAGISRWTLSRRLSGQSPFTVDEVASIADALDMDAAELTTALISAASTDSAA